MPRDEISMLTPDRRTMLITPEALEVLLEEANAHGLRTESTLEPVDHPSTWRRFRIHQA